MPVIPPTWQFDGCPHDGPSLVVAGDKLHIAWMDGRSGLPKVYYGVASRDDMKFTTRAINASAPGSQNNPRLSLDSQGHLHAVWEESLSVETPVAAETPAPDKSGSKKKRHDHSPMSGDGRAIMYSRIADNGAIIPRPVAKRVGAFQTRPAIACGPEGLVYVAFHELDTSGKRVVVTQTKPAK